MEKSDIMFYIGKSQVEQYVVNEDVNLVAVKFTDGSTAEYTVRQWDALKSETPYKDEDVQNRKWSPLVKRFLEEMLADNMRLMDKDFILNLVDNSIIQNYNHIVAQIFGVKDPLQIDLYKLDQVYHQMNPKNEEDKKDGIEIKFDNSGEEKKV